jgi:vacuolar protein sorting-associated protein VTA1
MQTKTEYADNDAIVDDMAGKAYVENFAQNTLDRAERAVQANKVTRWADHSFIPMNVLSDIWEPDKQPTPSMQPRHSSTY